MNINLLLCCYTSYPNFCKWFYFGLAFQYCIVYLGQFCAKEITKSLIFVCVFIWYQYLFKVHCFELWYSYFQSHPDLIFWIVTNRGFFFCFFLIFLAETWTGYHPRWNTKWRCQSRASVLRDHCGLPRGRPAAGVCRRRPARWVGKELKRFTQCYWIDLDELSKEVEYLHKQNVCCVQKKGPSLTVNITSLTHFASAFIDVRLRKLAEEKDELLAQIRKLKNQLEEERQKHSKMDSLYTDGERMENGTDLHFIEMQSELLLCLPAI